MKDREESRGPVPRRNQDEEENFMAEEAAPASIQNTSTLREGYSWIRALQARHPGWKLPAVEDALLTEPEKPLSESRVCLVSMGGIYRKGQKPFNTSPGPVPPALRAMRFRDRGDWTIREIPADCDPAELRIAHAHYDHGDGDDDINCVFPLARLVELELAGFIAQSAPFHYSMMGYSPETHPLLETVRREIIPRLRDHEVDVVLVSGGCDLSHQSAGLAQREIEGAGIPTVAVSVCPDITEGLLVPRAVALRFPLGNPFGGTLDAPMQTRILRDAFAQLEQVQEPGTVVTLPYEWVKE